MTHFTGGTFNEGAVALAQESEKPAEAISAAATVEHEFVFAAPASPYVRSALRDDEMRTRLSAVRALERQDGALVFDDLIIALSDEAWQVRRAAARGLARFADPATENALFDSLGDPAWQVIREAARGLARLRAGGDGRVARLLQHPIAEVRAAAATALGASRDAGWTLYLAPFWGDSSPVVRRAVQNAGERLEELILQQRRAVEL